MTHSPVSSNPSRTDPIAWLQAGAANHPERAFLSTPDGSGWTYRGAASDASRMAAALRGLGVQAGDRIAVQVEKSPEAFMLYLGCLWLGAVFVPLNTAYTPRELDYFFGDAQPKLVVVRPDVRESIAALPSMAPGTAQSPALHTLGSKGDGSFAEKFKQAIAGEVPAFQGSGDSLAALLYTSGTTGRSKGAMISRANLASNAVALVDAWRVTGDDVMLHALPIFHAHGLFIGANTLLAAGGQIRFLSGFDADEVMRELPHANLMMGVPTFYTRLLQHPDLSAANTSHVRLFISGSAPLLVDTHREFHALTGHAILERYAMTETLVITTNPYEGDRIPGAVGLPLQDVEVRIADLATGAVLEGADAIGVIEVRGPNLFKGYWRNPGKTAADMRPDGFFITGDIGRIDGRGYMQIVGRAKDLIISGGYNVYPKEVESEIDELPGVLESAVIGLAHRDFGEGVTAVVTLRPGAAVDESQVHEYLKTRLAKYKLPKRVLFLEELPRNALGKVQKNLLRDRFQLLYQSTP